MPSAALQLPADPAERRRLWREWTHSDSPRVQTTPVQRAMRRAVPALELWAQEAIDAPAAVTAGLRRAIEAAIIDGHLGIADRERLLRRAERLGVKRFEANLLIAAVQHRAAESRDERTIRATWKRPRKPRSVAKIVSACIACEAVAVLALAMWTRG
jgi:hypothetical protein